MSDARSARLGRCRGTHPRRQHNTSCRIEPGCQSTQCTSAHPSSCHTPATLHSASGRAGGRVGRWATGRSSCRCVRPPALSALTFAAHIAAWAVAIVAHQRVADAVVVDAPLVVAAACWMGEKVGGGESVFQGGLCTTHPRAPWGAPLGCALTGAAGCSVGQRARCRVLDATASATQVGGVAYLGPQVAALGAAGLQAQ